MCVVWCVCVRREWGGREESEEIKYACDVCECMSVCVGEGRHSQSL